MRKNTTHNGIAFISANPAYPTVADLLAIDVPLYIRTLLDDSHQVTCKHKYILHVSRLIIFLQSVHHQAMLALRALLAPPAMHDNLTVYFDTALSGTVPLRPSSSPVWTVDTLIISQWKTLLSREGENEDGKTLKYAGAETVRGHS